MKRALHILVTVAFLTLLTVAHAQSSSAQQRGARGEFTNPCEFAKPTESRVADIASAQRVNAIELGMLGVGKYCGIGVKKNRPEGLRLLRDSSERGNISATVALALAYANQGQWSAARRYATKYVCEYDGEPGMAAFWGQELFGNLVKHLPNAERAKFTTVLKTGCGTYSPRVLSKDLQEFSDVWKIFDTNIRREGYFAMMEISYFPFKGNPHAIAVTWGACTTSAKSRCGKVFIAVKGRFIGSATEEPTFGIATTESLGDGHFRIGYQTASRSENPVWVSYTWDGKHLIAEGTPPTTTKED